MPNLTRCEILCKPKLHRSEQCEWPSFSHATTSYGSTSMCYGSLKKFPSFINKQRAEFGSLPEIFISTFIFHSSQVMHFKISFQCPSASQKREC